MTGHTHQAYNCLVPKRDCTLVRVTSAGQYGRHLSDIDLTIDTRSRDVVAVTATHLATGTPTTVEDPALTALVSHHDGLSIGPKSRVIGRVTAPISRTANAAGESAQGDVIADAQRDATDDAGTGQAVAAFMNPGGIRADLAFNAPAGDVTYGDAFTVQPFGNSLATMTLTGAQIRTLLETQFPGCNGQTARRILQVSTGFVYQYTEGAACNGRVGNIAVNGAMVEPTTPYRVTVNSFLAHVRPAAPPTGQSDHHDGSRPRPRAVGRHRTDGAGARAAAAAEGSAAAPKLRVHRRGSPGRRVRLHAAVTGASCAPPSVARPQPPPSGSRSLHSPHEEFP